MNFEPAYRPGRLPPPLPERLPHKTRAVTAHPVIILYVSLILFLLAHTGSGGA